jgi:hypothetical protein
MDIRQKAKDFLITFPLVLILGGALLWGPVWVGGLLESRPPLEARKSETLSVAELEAGRPGDASSPLLLSRHRP